MARLFDGSDDKIVLANETNFDFERTQAFSVAFWLWIDSNTDSMLVAKQVNSGNNEGWAVFITSFQGPTLSFQLRNSGGNEIQRNSADAAIPTATWIHCCVTYDGSSTSGGMTIYVNGAQSGPAGSGTLSASILNNKAVTFGCRDDASPGLFLPGQLADVGIWNVQLTASEVHMLGNGAEPSTIRPASNSIALLRLCGTDSPELDSWGSNNGTLTGTIQSTHPLNSPSSCNPQQILRSVTSNLRW